MVGCVTKSGWKQGMQQRLDAATADREPLRSFFNWTRKELDADAYELLRWKKFKGGKFISFEYFAREKMRLAWSLGLGLSEPKRVLDLGCGAGHFLLVCRYLGHDAIGLDMPLPDEHLFHKLCRFFGVSKVDHLIVPFEPLPLTLGRFDLVVASRIKFDRFDDGERWSQRAWQFFLADLKRKHLKPNGKIRLALIGSQSRNDEAGQYLRTQGVLL
jgi:SAM-dependent methyltransferase